MKTALLCVATSATLALSFLVPAHADDTSFTGASAAIGVGAVRSHTEYGIIFRGNTIDHTAAVGKVDLSYGFNLASQWVTSVGATYDLNKTNLGTVHFTDSSGSFDSENKLKNHFSLYVAPGYRFASNWLGYAKLGWHTAKVEFNDGEIGRYETQHSGFGYGVGIATALSPHLELRFEIGHVDFNQKEKEDVTAKPDTTDGLVYLGYRF